ncbi:short-chain dehydrogenase [Aeromonas hydrophila]|uniref:short-chain dehydrogenase n=1 Tax=Aeromonas hydrophila TaxID=644 RepID=UPI001F536C62|nr:short-chain dehydrogenase [Aeromonas hydrophila]UUT58087.1 short-chain dehydrogenase [Aeromonas hydrophila]
MGYLILGSGGLGTALAHELSAHGEELVLAGRQLPKGVDPACYFPLQEVDVLSFDALFTLYDTAPLPSVVINTIGLLHDINFMPERRVEEVNPRWLCDSLLANAWPQLALAACLSRRMTVDTRLWLCSLSDLAGSLGANETGSRYSYRMSKAALNMGARTLAHEWRERFPAAGVVTVHPGLMATPMNQPFIDELAAETLQDPALVAPRLLDLINQLSPAQSGGFLDLQGQPLPW